MAPVGFRQVGVRGQFVELEVGGKLVSKVLLSDLADFVWTARRAAAEQYPCDTIRNAYFAQ